MLDYLFFWSPLSVLNFSLTKSIPHLFVSSTAVARQEYQLAGWGIGSQWPGWGQEENGMSVEMTPREFKSEEPAASVNHGKSAQWALWRRHHADMTRWRTGRRVSAQTTGNLKYTVLVQRDRQRCFQQMLPDGCFCEKYKESDALDINVSGGGQGCTTQWLPH